MKVSMTKDSYEYFQSNSMPQAPPQREVQQDIVSLAHGPAQGSSCGLVLPFAGILAHDKVWAYQVGHIHAGFHEPPKDIIDVVFLGGKQWPGTPACTAARRGGVPSLDTLPEGVVF